VARVQHGVVTRVQLLGAGLPAHRLERRVRTRRLRPVHRGVYLVGPLVSSRAMEMAAVLACGAGSRVSHRSAARLLGLWDRPPDSAPVEVRVAGCDRGRRPGIRAYRGPALTAGEVVTVDGIPVTSPTRTLLDLASVVGRAELERAVARAERLELVDRADLSALIARGRGRPGIPLLRAVMEQPGGPVLTRSEAEERFLALIRRFRLPPPVVNARVAGYEVDFLWRAEGIAVEVDGFAYHSSARRFERDRRRDADLAAAGIQVIRVTWRQIVREPEAVMGRLALTLGAARRSRVTGS
jgi:very-short-patch-repair endonuclease